MQLIVNFTKNIRIFFFGIDWLLYNFIPTIYNFIITISRTSILSQGQIKDIGGRIQALLGVFMLFKVSFSIITYIINPDEFSDKSKGFAKLWQNAIISLILLILTPYIFGMAYDLQAKLLEDNSLMYLVFGDKNKIDSNFKSNAGQEIAFSVMIPFFLPHTANGDNINHDISSCNNVLNEDNTFNNECMEAMLDETRDQRNDESDAITIENYTKGIELRNLGLTFRSDAALMTTNWNDSFVINYKFLISTAVAVVVLLILITFCMDVALRSVKLAFLQLIAPIPIISYIDPKQGKDGMFKKWYQMCFSTYLSLFVRLLALYLGVYMIGIVVSTGATDIVTGESVDNFLVQLVMIIGILMFVKQLPKILEGLGIKLDGGGKFQLNPFKKFEEEAFGGKRILGAAGGLVSGVADRGARIMAASNGRERAAAIAGSLIGVPGATIRGFRDGKGFTSGLKAQNTVNRRLREGRIKGLSVAQSYLDYAGSLFGLDDASLERESRINYRNGQTLKEMERRAEEVSREENLSATQLEHRNAQRKETLQRISDAHSKGDSIQKFTESFVKKKADFGVVTDGDAIDYSLLAGQRGHALTSDFTLSDGTTYAAGRMVDDALLDDVAKRLNFDSADRKNAEVYGYALSAPIGATFSRDYKLSDGTTISAGTVIDDNAVNVIKNRLSKNYTRTIKINDTNLEMLRQMQKNKETLTFDVTIGDRIFRTGEMVTAEMVADADSSAYDYEKFANKQVQNMFVNNDLSIRETDRNEFIGKRDDYLTAIDNVNESIGAYNAAYGTTIGQFNNGVDYDQLDSSIKDLGNRTEVVNMRTLSSNIENEIVRHKQNAANAKDNVTGHLLDERGNIIVDPSTGAAREYGIDEFKSIHTPRDEATKRVLEQHKESRSMVSNLNNK